MTPHDIIEKELKEADRWHKGKATLLIEELLSQIDAYYKTWNRPIQYAVLTRKYGLAFSRITKLPYQKILQYLEETQKIVVIMSPSAARYVYPGHKREDFDQLLVQVVEIDQDKIDTANYNRAKKMKGNSNARLKRTKEAH